MSERGDALPIVILRNLRQAWRHLRQSPGFTAIAVLSLGLGIGANTAIFSLVNAVLIRESPLDSPDELVNIYLRTPDFEWGVCSYPDFEDLRDGTTGVLSHVSASRFILAQVDRGGDVDTLPGEAVTGAYFTTRGLEAQLGRTLLPEDDVSPGGHPVVVLSDAYWRSGFGGDPAIVGQELRLAGRAFTVVGVAPAEYAGNLRGIEPALYAPMMMVNELVAGTSDELENRGNHSLFVLGRLAPGATRAALQAAADAVSTRLAEQQVEDWDPDGRFSLLPTREVVLYPPIDRFVRAAAWLLMVVVGLVLLMACMNLASFLLARALDRRREIAVRLALGASRRALVGQLLTETTLLGLLGGVAGVVLSVGLLQLLVHADLPIPLPVTLDLDPDARVLGFSLLISLATGLLLGLAPALQSTSPDVSSTLKGETAGGGQPGKRRLRNALVLAQVTASVVLLVGAGLFLRSFQAVQSIDPGFGRQPAGLLSVIVPPNRYAEAEGRLLTRQLRERFERLPGVESVGLIDNLHLNPLNTQSIQFNVDDVEPPPGRDGHVADRATAGPAFFEAAGIPLLAGRNFAETDDGNAPPVAIVSAALARRFWGSPDAALGRSLRRADDPDLQVVGVAADTKVRTLGEAPRSFVYLPYSQRYSSFVTLVARTSRDAGSLAVEMVAAGREVDADLWVFEAKSMRRHMAAMELPARLSAILLSVFAGLALTLACVGLYGTVSYAVARRTREVGIRMALGADSPAVLRLLMGGGLRLVLIGGAIGLAVSVAVSRLLSGLLFEIGTLDPWTFVLVPATLGLATALAAWVPARRAVRIAPAEALRVD